MLKKSYVSVQYIDPGESVGVGHVMIGGTIISDIDHNGFLDLVTFPSNYIIDKPLKAVAWLNTNGSFLATPSAIANSGLYQYVRDSVPGDFNNDGYQDFLQIDQGWELNNRDPNYYYGNHPSLILGGAQGLTWQKLDTWLTNQGGGQSFNHIGDAADYDQDGDLDVVVAAFWDFRVYENQGNGTFAWREDLLPGKFNYEANVWGPSGATFIDLNGRYAIVSGTYRAWDVNSPVAPLSVLIQQNGQFVESYTLARPNLGHGRERNYGVSDMFNMDLNGDGREDLLVMWETEPSGGINDGMSNLTGDSTVTRYKDLSNTVFSVYFQDATGRLVADQGYINGADATGGPPLFFEDFNLDGHVDFWVGTWFGKPSNFDSLVYINDGTGHFSHPKNMFTTSESFPDWYTLQPYFFDANNDGAVDVVATNGIFPPGSSQTIGQEVRTFLSDSPAYNINGNNKFLAVLTDRTWNGGAGTDTAVFSGAFQDYIVSQNNQGHITLTDKVIGRDGVDSFVNVERFKFDDGVIAIDFDGTAGQAYRLYTAALDREPDLEGLGYWISALDRGESLKNVANAFVNSPEFRTNFYGDGSNATFVTALYNNVLDRAPDAGGYDYWLGALNRGESRADVLLGFSESPENYANAVQLTGGAVVYQEWML